MRERRTRLPVVLRGGLTLQPRKLALEVVHEHLRHVVCEPPPDDDPKRGKVGPVLGERVRRHLPAPLAQRVGDVEHGEALDAGVQREGEYRQLVALAFTRDF